MTEQFNRLNKKFGANQVSLIESNATSMRLRIGHFGDFWLFRNGGMLERADGRVFETANSRWLAAIANGGVRDESGVVS